MTTDEIIEFLESKIRHAESTAEECFQEIEDEESGNSHLAKASAFKEVLEYIQSENIDQP